MPSALSGLLLVLTATLTFGSFGVPIKSARVLEAQVDPVVLQCYKTAACFGTCWLALLLTRFTFTPWGLVGGLAWVMNGIAAIVAIQGAGLGLSQAIWSALGIAISFLWGVLVFSEPVRHMPLACAGLAVMSLGIAGMGLVAGTCPPPRTLHPGEANSAAPDADLEAARLLGDGLRSSAGSVKEVQLAPAGEPLGGPDGLHTPFTAAFGPASATVAAKAAGQREDTAAEASAAAADGLAASGASPVRPDVSAARAADTAKRRRARGLACAVYVGVANGSFLVPLKYANHVTGASYIISFGIGSAVVTAAVLAAYSAALHVQGRRRPAFKLRAVGPPGLLAGLLWSAGNFSGTLATEQLGLSLAWPLIQCQLLVSTAWGVLYYGEQRGTTQIAAMVGSTCLVIVGAVMLMFGK